MSRCGFLLTFNLNLPPATGSCTVQGILPMYRKACDNHAFCFARAHIEDDPCPTVSKYLEIVFSCEQKGNPFLISFILVCPDHITSQM